MERRQFIRNSLLFSASTFLIPTIGCSIQNDKEERFKMLGSLQLSDFDDEQDEAPMLFQNRKNTYLTTLRRLEYPSDKEVITLFRKDGDNWVEQSPITAKPGSYECHYADCHLDGNPAVAWSEVISHQWVIYVTVQKDGVFSSPIAVSDSKKKSINPVLKALAKNVYLLAWECFEEGKFSIYLSKYDKGSWSSPVRVSDKSDNCFNPSLEQDDYGNIYIAYDTNEGPHRNIQMKILNSEFVEQSTVPIAIGGGFKDRVNINVKPNICFDNTGKLWISWENNRFAHRLEDSDNYTGDRCCAMVCYSDGVLYEEKVNGRWLFKGKNDHWPTFQKDLKGQLYILSHCGGDFEGSPYWKFRISYLDPAKGWSSPQTIIQTKQKGESIRPTISFESKNNSFWLAWKSENFKDRDYDNTDKDNHRKDSIRRGMLEINQFAAPIFKDQNSEITLIPTIVEEHHTVDGFKPVLSGRPKSKRSKITYKGETYTLLLGNLHEHSEISSCWPAGTDGTLHDDYRYGLYSEGYDFMGITDHAYSQTEVYWRKHLRLADFYNDYSNFVAFPSVEFTLSNRRTFEIKRGAGHRNVIFTTTDDAKKYIRDKDQVYSVKSPKTRDAEGLWKFIRENDIDCISIPHHPADEVHSCCWETRDAEIEPVVEIFQCRGNAEYRGAPRMINIDRHKPSENDKGFIDYALREKGHKLGFIASGDHNSIGVGLACVWVKEISRKGIMEAFRNRRVFATTGDQMEVDFRVNNAIQGQTTKRKTPNLFFSIKAVDDIKSIEILRNSNVIHSITPEKESYSYTGNFVDGHSVNKRGVLYYYIRITQKNNHIAWSSPIWMES